MNVNNDDFASGDVWLIAEPGGHSNLEGANPVRTSSRRARFIDRLQHRLVELVHDVTAAVYYNPTRDAVKIGAISPFNP